ncbi:hypothetical protein N0V83_005794 [Neocucurbitaria cava]|uniref:Uncharacterized protein n=1 Tax=Neocucurbitaria cava TaxID=798079 RepID=A0A9W9CMD7_9PLEO|nr:hypothetical protein N0V83_005794 [Neocucurbitaria cava]
MSDTGFVRAGPVNATNDDHRQALARLDQVFQSNRSANAEIIVDMTHPVTTAPDQTTGSHEKNEDDDKDKDKNQNNNGEKEKRFKDENENIKEDKHDRTHNARLWFPAREQTKADLSEEPRPCDSEIHKRLLIPFFLAMIMLILSVCYILGPGAKFIDDRAVRLRRALVSYALLFGHFNAHKALAISKAVRLGFPPFFGCGILGYCLALRRSGTGGDEEVQGVISRTRSDFDYWNASKAPLTIEIMDAEMSAEKPPRTAGILSNPGEAAILVAQFGIAIHACMVTGDLSTLLLFMTCKFLMDTIACLSLCTTGRFTACNGCSGGNAAYTWICGLIQQEIIIIRGAHKDLWNLGNPGSATVPRKNHYGTIENRVAIMVSLSLITITYLAKLLSVSASASLLCIMVVGAFGHLMIIDLLRSFGKSDVALKSVEIIQDDNGSILALQRLEEKYPGLGEQLVKKMFHDGLRGEEKASWEKFRVEREEQKQGRTLETEISEKDKVVSKNTEK